MPVRSTTPLAVTTSKPRTLSALAQGAVAHGVGTAGARGARSAQRRVGTWVNRGKQATAFQRFIELLARHAGLHGDGQVLGANGHDHQHTVPRGQAHGGELARLQQARWGLTNLGEAMDCKGFLGSINSKTITIATTSALK